MTLQTTHATRIATAGRASRGSNLALILVTVAAVLVAACTGGDGEPTGSAEPTAARTPAGAIPPTETPSPDGTPSPGATDTPSPGATGAPGPGWGVVTVDVASGAVATLYDAPESFRAAADSTVGPWPEPRNGAIWLSPTTAGATRYLLDGTAERTIEGWGVVESADGRSLSYFRDAVDGITLVAERDGRPTEAPGAGAIGRTFSPDGSRLAWVDYSDVESPEVLVLSLESGEVRTVAAVAPCRCDGYHYLEWSPSGRYLAYDHPAFEDPATQGIYVYDSVEPADGPIRVAEGAVQPGAWVRADDLERLVVVVDGAPTLLPPVTPSSDATSGNAESGSVESGDEPLPLNIGALDGSIQVSALQGLVRVVLRGDRTERTLIFDPVSGERLRELQGIADTVLTPQGIATAVITRNDLACTGIDVEHPAYQDTLPCDADDVLWSPDGRLLALVPQAESAPVEILDVTTGEATEVSHAGPRGAHPQWSAGGRYLVWVWGQGL